MVLIFAGAFGLVAWLYLIVGRGGFWYEFLPRQPERQAETAALPSPGILAVIPARNEAELVGSAIASIAQQQYAGRLHIVLVDDESSDGTAEAARAAAPPELLTVVRARPLPSGWTGKLWAMAEGIRQAPFEPDALLLTDADIIHPLENLKTLSAHLAGGYDMVSFMATLACRTPAERALIPAFIFFFFLLYPPTWVRSRRRKVAGAAGGCILIRRSMLDRIGGIAAIRAELIDDCALAGAVKRHGGRVWLGLSSGTRSVRPYTSFREIGRMISRSAFTQLRHSTLLLIGTTLGLFLTLLLPPLLTLFAPQPAAGLGACTWLLMSIAYFPALRFYRCPWFWAPLLPAVALFYLGAMFHSAVSYWRGTGGLWKGRVQDARRSTS